jgi:MFS family permease
MSDLAGTSSGPVPDSSVPTKKHPLALPHVRNLWIGSLISLIGDQFYLVALPWLVLQITNSGVALGTVLMTTAVPRAVLMLAGGAVTDRLSARRVLLATALVRTLLVGAVAALIWLGVIRLWHLYILTFAFGVADAFSLPAGSALVPTLVEPDQLGSTNALLQGAAIFAQMVGPIPAGVMIRVWGIAAALFADAASFLGVIVAVWRLPEPVVAAASTTGPRPDFLGSITEGLRAVRDDHPLRALMGLYATLYLLIYGPIIVGLAAAAKMRFGSATAFASCLVALSVGMLLGVVVGGRVKKPRHRGLQFIGMSAVCGAALMGVGLFMKLAVAVSLLVVMGAGLGFVNVQFTSWVQIRVERAMLGRVTSVLLFAAVGMIPVSYAIAGVLAQWNLERLFVLSGGLLILASALALNSRDARAID